MQIPQFRQHVWFTALEKNENIVNLGCMLQMLKEQVFCEKKRMQKKRNLEDEKWEYGIFIS